MSESSYALGEAALGDMVTLFAVSGASPRNMDVYAPGTHQRIPAQGAWIIVTKQLPPMEHALDTRIRVACVFYGERMDGTDDDGFGRDGAYKIQVHSPWGTIVLWPYEYATIDPAAVLAMWQDGEVQFHPTNVEPARLNEIVFYARSHGIALADAMVMALGTLQGPVGWFEPRPDLQEAAEAMSARVHEWSWPRRTLHVGGGE